MQINQMVASLDDDFEGRIVAIDGDQIAVKGADGFVLSFRESELIPIIDPEIKAQLAHVPDHIIAEKAAELKKSTPKVRPKERNLPIMEVDLHIHKITDRDKGMSNYEILNLQIDTAQYKLEFAIKKRIKKIVFIHGVGEGVLREELYTLFRRYENVKYYDADFQKYGVGATEVYIYQN